MLSTKSFVDKRGDTHLPAAPARWQTEIRTVSVTAIRFFWTSILDNDFSRHYAPRAHKYRSIVGVIYSGIGPDPAKTVRSGQRKRRGARERPSVQQSRDFGSVDDVVIFVIVVTFSHTIVPNKNRFRTATS
jgi:hypothetical protein